MKKSLIIFIAIVFLAAILRLFKLASIPAGFANDEAAITYQSYSILLTGKDTWGQFMPLFSFKDFGEHLPPFAVYTQIPFIKVFGLNEFGARLPFALTGIIAVFPMYVLTKKLLKNKKVALLTCFLFAVSPLNLGWSRFVYEGNFGMLFYLVAITFFVSAKKNIKLLLPAAFFFGLTFTTYHIFYLITPLTVILLYIPKAASLWQRNKSTQLLAIIIGIIFTFYASLIVASGAGRERFRQVSIFANNNALNQININRSYCSQGLNGNICRLFFNKATNYISQYSYNYLFHFSPTFLALNGTFLRSTIMPLHGLIYPFELPFFYLGIVTLAVMRNETSYILLGLLLLYPLANSFTSVGEISRIANAMPVLPIISAIGIYKGYNFITANKLKRPIIAAFMIFAIFNFLSFLVNYFVVFPKSNSQFGSYAYTRLFKQIRQSNFPYERYFISRDYTGNSPEFQARIFLPINPLAFQQSDRNQYIIKKPQGYVNYQRLDNFYFFNNLDEVDATDQDLIVLSKNQFNQNSQYTPRRIFDIKEPNGDLALIAVLGGATENKAK